MKSPLAKLLLLYYNKVTNEAFNKLALHNSEFEIIPFDLGRFGDKMDILDEKVVEEFLSQSMPFDAVVVGDIFWPTGQYICKWCKKHNIKSFFLQHGQWIYITNKKNPEFLPYCTFLYGDNVKDMVSLWPYSARSKVVVTGSPKYDNIIPNSSGSYVYFCPPVMYEKINGTHRSNPLASRLLKTLSGIDKKIELLIQPHYREGNISGLKQMFSFAEFSDPKNDPICLIKKSYAVLTHRDSTTVLDAIACGKKSFLINFKNQHRSFYKAGYFSNFAVENGWPDECKDRIQSYVAGELPDNYEMLSKPYLYLGNSSERILAIIKESLNVS